MWACNIPTPPMSLAPARFTSTRGGANFRGGQVHQHSKGGQRHGGPRSGPDPAGSWAKLGGRAQVRTQKWSFWGVQCARSAGNYLKNMKNWILAHFLVLFSAPAAPKPGGPGSPAHKGGPTLGGAKFTSTRGGANDSGGPTTRGGKVPPPPALNTPKFPGKYAWHRGCDKRSTVSRASDLDLQWKKKN